MVTREERDTMGKKILPSGVYYGIQTLRAMENFPVSGIREPPEFVRAYALVKKAAACTNMELGALDTKRGNAIVRAADEVLAGTHADQFPVDVFQAGAGTSFNMNMNEVLANRALEILGRKRGEYRFLSPNDHVNCSQSTNDTFPTASHVAILTQADRLLGTLDGLADAFRKKGDAFNGIAKSGRTHLMDALPLTLGNEFHAYGSALQYSAGRMRDRREGLLEVALGGTAVGSGANTPEGYTERAVAVLAELTSLPLVPARDRYEAIQSRAPMAAFSGSLRELASELIRIANDLRLLGSGPATGIAEIELPPVQPGSSMMAGKVNPVMAECLDMIAFQVVGNDTVVSLASQGGQLELNVMTPVMTHAILQSLGLLNNFLPVFQEKCVEGIRADPDRCRHYLELNPILSTLLVPKIGYRKAALLAQEAARTKNAVIPLAVEHGLITAQEARNLQEQVFGRGTRKRPER
jgi:aspartate ammonia-lyase